MAGRRLLGANGKFITPNNKKASVAAVVASNNENLFKLIASEKSHISQVNSATPDFNTVMKNYGTFSNDTYEATLAAEKARVDAFTSMPDDKSQTQLTDFDENTKLKRKIEAENVIEQSQNVKQDLLRQELSTVAPGDDVSRAYDFTKQGEFQPKPVFEEKPSLVLNEDTGIQTTASGERLDAIGREINQTFTNVGQESYQGLNTDELAFSAIEAIKNEEKAVTTEKIEYIDPHKYNRDGKGQIITNTPAHNQLHSEKTAAVVDHSISGNNQKVYAETLKLEKDTKELAIEAKKLADAAELQAEKDASAALVAESLALSQENLKQSGIEQSALQREKDVADRIKKIEKEQAKKLENERLVADANANQEKNNFVYNAMNNQDSGQNTVLKNGIASSGSTTGSASDSSHSQYDIANNRFVEVTKQAEQDAINNTTIKDMTTTVRELAAEKAEKDRAEKQRVELAKKTQESLNNEQLTNARNKEAADTQRSLDDEQLTNARNKEAADTQRSLDDEQKFMQIKNEQDQLISSGPSTRPPIGKFRKLQAEKQLAKEMEVAKRVGDHMDRNQVPKVGKNMWPLQNDPYSFSTLSYPPDATNSKENGHFVLFYVNVQNKTKYQYDGWSEGKRVRVGDYIERPGYFENPDVTNVPPSLRGANKYISSLEASGLGANAGSVDYQRQIVKNGGPGNILYNNMAFLSKGRKPKSGINSRYPTTTRITDSVALYLPSGIGNTTSASYGDFQTGVAGYLAMSGLDIVSELRNRDFQGAAEKIFGVGGTLITEAAKKLAVAGIETFTGSEGIQQSVDKAFGQTLNPYIEVAFNSTGMRTFDYTFKFAPKSKKETDEVQAIIQLFRFHMLPEMKSSAHRYLTLPSTFDIHYMWQSGIDERGYTSVMAKENSFYNKIATCVLTNVDVNYTPNGQVQSFADGAPTQIDMSLSFKETEMLTKQHIQEGF